MPYALTGIAAGGSNQIFHRKGLHSDELLATRGERLLPANPNLRTVLRVIASGALGRLFRPLITSRSHNPCKPIIDKSQKGLR